METSVADSKSLHSSSDPTFHFCLKSGSGYEFLVRQKNLIILVNVVFLFLFLFYLLKIWYRTYSMPADYLHVGWAS